MNSLWIILLTSGYLYSFLVGNTTETTGILLNSTIDAVNLCIKLLGNICFWSGLLEVAKKSGLTEKIAKVFSPILNKLFPGIFGNNSAKGAIVMNLTANMLGLGNTATPMGIKAMRELQKDNTNKDTVSDSMIMFIVMNTAMLQLIPTTVISIRTSYAAANPTDILPVVWISSCIEMLVAIPVARLVIYLCSQKNVYKKRSGKHGHRT